MGLWYFLKDLLKSGKEEIEKLAMEELEIIPVENKNALEPGVKYQINDVVSMYIKIEYPAVLTNRENINFAAEIHQLVTERLISILKEFKAGFIDIKENGGFALWKEEFGSVKALLAGEIFKTSIVKELQEYVKNRIADLTVAIKIGIVKEMVLFKKTGTKDTQDKKSNWAVCKGEALDYSSKLSGIAASDTILVTENVFSDFSIPPELSQYLIAACGCKQVTRGRLWHERIDLKGEFGTKIFEHKSSWCDVHGQTFREYVLIIINK